MSNQRKDKDLWQYATFEGAESFQRQQTAKMSFSQRLQALDDMIRLVQGLHSGKRHTPNPLRHSKQSSED